jgi:copper transport protein
VRARRALMAAGLALALLPASASAHAQLESTSPARGAQLKASPAQVELRFGESVEASFGALRVYDNRGHEVQVGAATHPAGQGDRVAVKLRPHLPQGGYTATYRVISADSHPVSGGFVFTVGDGAAPAGTVDQLLKGSESGPITSIAFAVARGVQFAAIAIGLGALIFLLWAWLPALRMVSGGEPAWRTASGAFASRLRGLLLVAAGAGVLSAAAGLVMQGATASGTTAWGALDPTVIGDVLSTRFGVVWGLALLAWLWVGIVGLLLRSRLPVLRPAAVGASGLALPSATSPTLVALALPLFALALLPGLGGHAGAEAPVVLNLPANVLHILAMSAWLGGIVVLVAVARSATARLDGADRTRLLAASVGRFSTLAGVAIAVILATGVIQALISTNSVSELVDTAYGRAVLVKLVLFLGIVGLGWVNRSRHLPELRRAAAGGATPGAAGAALRKTLRAELIVGAAVLAATGALAGYAPAKAVSSGPFSSDKVLGPARLEATVDPARVGPNEVHLYLFNRRDGSQFTGVKELTVQASLSAKRIAPIELQAEKAGPGHYVVTRGDFGVRGDWRVEVVARVSEFDEYSTTLKVPIR